MGEVSRLLIASPRLGPMEMFFLILFSSLIGIDAPYLLIIIILFFLLLYHYMDTTVSYRHWGTHLDHHPFLHHSKRRGVVVPSHFIKAVSRFGGYIN